MSRKLARGREKAVSLIEVQGAYHNDVVAQNHSGQLIRALREIGLP
jgi:hypothetical protein